MMRWVALAFAAVALGMVIAVQADQTSLYKTSTNWGEVSGGLWESEISTRFGSLKFKNGDYYTGDRADTYKAAQAFGIITAITILPGMIGTAFFRSLRIPMMLHAAAAVFSFTLFVLCLVLFVHDWSTNNSTTARLSDNHDVNYGMFLALLSSILLGIAAFLCTRDSARHNEPISV